MFLRFIKRNRLRTALICFISIFSLHNKAQVTNRFNDPPADPKIKQEYEAKHDMGYVNAIRTSSYFRETYVENVPLSNVSFFTNQRFFSDPFEKRKTCILDAATNNYVPLLGNYAFNRCKKTGHTFLIAAYLIPAFDVRIYKTDSCVGDYSKPVRTPSYKACGEFVFTSTRFWSYKDDESKRHKTAAFFKMYHHSNGQDGNSIMDTSTLSTKKGMINTYNGNFSDDFPLQFGLLHMIDSKNHSFFIKAGYEFSQYLWFGIDAMTDKYNLYATERIMISGNYKYKAVYDLLLKKSKQRPLMSNYTVEHFRVEYYLTYFTTSPKKWNYGSVDLKADEQLGLRPVDYLNKRRLNVGLALHWRLPGTRSTGLFIQAGYHGQDPYNVYFQRVNKFARFGLSFGHFTYPKKTDDLLPAY